MPTDCTYHSLVPRPHPTPCVGDWELGARLRVLLNIRICQPFTASVYKLQILYSTHAVCFEPKSQKSVPANNYYPKVPSMSATCVTHSVITCAYYLCVLLRMFYHHYQTCLYTLLVINLIITYLNIGCTEAVVLCM